MNITFSPTLSFILFSYFSILIAFFISFIHLSFFFYPSFCLSLYFIFSSSPFISLPFHSPYLPFPSSLFSSKFYSGHFTFSIFQLLTLSFHNLLIFSLKFSLFLFIYSSTLYLFHSLYLFHISYLIFPPCTHYLVNNLYPIHL